MVPIAGETDDSHQLTCGRDKFSHLSPEFPTPMQLTNPGHLNQSNPQTAPPMSTTIYLPYITNSDTFPHHTITADSLSFMFIKDFIYLVSWQKKEWQIYLSDFSFRVWFWLKSSEAETRQSRVVAKDDLSQNQTRKLKMDEATVLFTINTAVDLVLCVKYSKIWNNRSLQIILGWYGFY